MASGPDIYHPALTGDEFRILCLVPLLETDKTHPLPFSLVFERCSLSQSDLEPYVALSYAWGDENNTVPLRVADATINITPNLFTILHSLFKNNAASRFWIDALCINQKNTTERSAQVKLMRYIFSQASCVNVFLSHTSADCDLGISYLERAASHPEEHFQPSDSPTLTINGLSMPSEALRNSYIAFFAFPWWTRMWTVQEFVLARKVIFLCGDRSLDGEVLNKAFVSLRYHERNCCWTSASTTDGYTRGWLDMPSAASNGLTVFRSMLRFDELHAVGNLEQRIICDLLAVMGYLRPRKCSDPRDRVYGLLGLHVKDEGVRDAVQASYDNSTIEIYQSLALTTIAQSKTLDVLSHVRPSTIKRNKTQGLPTWVPDWNAEMEDLVHLLYRERIAVLNRYYTTKNAEPTWRVENSRVVTKGVFIGKIIADAPGYPQQNSQFSGRQLLNTWIDTSGYASENYDASGSRRVTKNFVALVAGGLTRPKWEKHKDGEGSRADQFRNWCDWFTSEASLPSSHEVRNDIREFDTLVQTVSFGRRMFKTDTNYVGFGPETIRTGDEVVIIPGGRVPYVLRQYQSHARGIYEFLGDSYANGVTKGEIALDDDKMTSFELI